MAIACIQAATQSQAQSCVYANGFLRCTNSNNPGNTAVAFGGTDGGQNTQLFAGNGFPGSFNPGFSGFPGNFPFGGAQFPFGRRRRSVLVSDELSLWNPRGLIRNPVVHWGSSFGKRIRYSRSIDIFAVSNDWQPTLLWSRLFRRSRKQKAYVQEEFADFEANQHQCALELRCIISKIKQEAAENVNLSIDEKEKTVQDELNSSSKICSRKANGKTIRVRTVCDVGPKDGFYRNSTGDIDSGFRMQLKLHEQFYS
ncbi:hypothetical protein CEXT_530131 [Caerostris extrusa]|uniref:Uncharacterized protein n=1 Tax=Caerostris extrusa TaxID=172846 RepID=A0AAV4TIE2_CAEEX|nr:hypothetical protein CEXT_530131 [Caerostris extrusa]